uniref:Uncharacterized protein n=1 Tax=Sinocyclocheilus rhinocerous TaxID=307959 RepID=A0A673I207_9TELE
MTIVGPPALEYLNKIIKKVIVIFFLSHNSDFSLTNAMIESGSEAKLCASLLKPNESLVMNIYVVHGDQSTLLLQEKDIISHQAPLVEAESVQRMKVELQGESFKMTEERKVMFRSYHPLTFIQTDKPIYIPGQTGLYPLLDKTAF